MYGEIENKMTSHLSRTHDSVDLMPNEEKRHTSTLPTCDISKRLTFGIDQILESKTKFKRPSEAFSPQNYKDHAFICHFDSRMEVDEFEMERENSSTDQPFRHGESASGVQRPRDKVSDDGLSESRTGNTGTSLSLHVPGTYSTCLDLIASRLYPDISWQILGSGVSPYTASKRTSHPQFTEQYLCAWQRDRFGVVRRVGHPYQNRAPPKRKKPRTSFSRQQIVELEKRFHGQKYLASAERSSLAKQLKMTDAQVKTWFQNRRTKWRRQTAEEREMERQATHKFLLSLRSNDSDPLYSPAGAPPQSP